MAAPTFYYYWDVDEPRNSKPRLVLSADGASWDTSFSSGIWQDPVTQTVMLLPLPFTPEWLTTFTGNYARLGKPDFTFPDAAKWRETHRIADGDKYITAIGAVADTAVSTTTYAVNQPFYLSVYIPDLPGASKQIALEFGITKGSTPGTTAGDIGIRLWADGTVSLYVAESVSGTVTPVIKSSTNLQGYTTDAGIQRQTPAKSAGKTVELLMIPMMGNSILLWTSEGQGTLIPVKSTPDGFARPTYGDSTGQTFGMGSVTPSGKFFFKVPSPAKACVQIAPLKFVESGDLYSREIQLRYPIVAADSRSWSYYPANSWVGRSTALVSSTGPGYVLYARDSVYGNVINPATNDVEATAARLHYHLTASSDRTASPLIYAADMILPALFTATSDERSNQTCNLLSADLSVGEDGRATLRASQLIAGRTPSYQEIQDGRTGRLYVDPGFGSNLYCLFSGTASAPESSFISGRAAADGLIADYTLYDRTGLLDESQFLDTVPYDGFQLTDALASLFADAGVPTAMIAGVSLDLSLPFVAADSASGNWALLPQRGDTRGQWLQRLLSDYAASHTVGWRPLNESGSATYKWVFIPPTSLSSSVKAVAYLSKSNTTSGALIESLKYSYLPPEVNKVIVVGYNPNGRTVAERYPTAERNDYDSQNPALALSSRTQAWRGRVLPFQYLQPSLTTQAQVEAAADILQGRLMVTRPTIQSVGDPLFDATTGCPLWIGDVFRIVRAGGLSWVNYRITSIPSLSLSATAGRAIATYNAVYVSEGTF